MKKLFLIAALLVSQPAWAIIDIQGYAGKRTTKAKGGDDVDVTNLGAAIHFGLIPFVPIAFGLAAEIDSPDTEGNVDTAKTYVLEPEIYGWIPLGVAGLSPYAKLGYAFNWTKTEFKDGETDSAAQYSSGTHISAGVKWDVPVVPFLSLLLEYDRGFENVSEIEFDGGPADGKDDVDVDVSTNTWRLGVEFKI